MTIENLTYNITNAVNKLSAETPFVSYKLEITPEEREALDRIKFKCNVIDYFYHYQIDSTLPFSTSDFGNYLKLITPAGSNIEPIVNLVDRVFAANILDNNNSEITLLDVRLTSKNEGCVATQAKNIIGYLFTGTDTDNWHADSLLEGFLYRNFISLSGPTTLFLNDAKAISEIINLEKQNKYIKSDNTTFVDPSKIVRPEIGEGMVFFQGGENPAYHAAPDKNEEFSTRIVLVFDKSPNQEKLNEYYEDGVTFRKTQKEFLDALELLKPQDVSVFTKFFNQGSSYKVDHIDPCTIKTHIEELISENFQFPKIFLNHLDIDYNCNRYQAAMAEAMGESSCNNQDCHEIA